VNVTVSHSETELTGNAFDSIGITRVTEGQVETTSQFLSKENRWDQ
jgi:hypothetical protein